MSLQKHMDPFLPARLDWSKLIVVTMGDLQKVYQKFKN
jgi:hypothetical protein